MNRKTKPAFILRVYTADSRGMETMRNYEYATRDEAVHHASTLLEAAETRAVAMIDERTGSGCYVPIWQRAS